MRIRFGLAVSSAAILVASAAAAQQVPIYDRSSGDTLRYREITSSTSELLTPQGVVPIRSEHDAILAITFGPGDTAQAWYEALEIRAETPQGTQSPGTADALGLPFVLRFNPRGSVEVLSAPEFPASFADITDLTHQFDDYFVPLPDLVLGPGVEWTDTIVRHDTTSDRSTAGTQRIAHYRVLGDSIVNGVSVQVIEARVDLMRNMSGPGPAEGITVRSVMTGEEKGLVFWSAEQRRLIGRQRSAELEGEVRFLGGPQPMVVPMRERYDNTLKLMP